MIAHVVLFQPRADLSSVEREAFRESFERALARIPHVRRVRVGERKNFDRVYDRQNARNFSHVAIIEFESETDLLAYLEHPDHKALGRSLYEAAEATLVFDFELLEGKDTGEVFRKG